MRKPNLIGLYSPVPGCGKDTMARHLAKYGYAEAKNGAPMKAMLRALYLALGYPESEMAEMLDGPRRDQIELFPAETIQMPSESMGMVEVKIPAVTCRGVPQTLGTEWGRQRVHRDLWVTCARRTIERSLRAGVPVVVSDVRFPNEYKLIRELGGEMWFVDRPQAPRPLKPHASDGALDGDWFELRLRNSSSILSLEAAIDSYLNMTA